MIPLKILGPKAVLAFAIALAIALNSANLTFSLLYGFHATLDDALGGLAGGSIVMHEDARSIYTSQIPMKIGTSLSKIPGVKAEALILTPTIVRGVTLVVRGVSNTTEYRDRIVAGTAPAEGAWSLLGWEAQRRLGLKVGEVLLLGSTTAPDIVPLPLTGVYRMGDLRDFEAVIPLITGYAVAGRPYGLASFIRVEGLSPREIEDLLRARHNLTIEYEYMDGKLLILDSSSDPVTIFDAEGAGSKTLTLSFGYYTIILQRAYFTTNLTSLLLSEDMKVDVGGVRRDEIKLKVISGPDLRPELKLENGDIFLGDWEDNVWAFKAGSGLHTLSIADSEYLLPLFGDTIFEPQRANTALGEAEIHVYWQDGSPVKDYLLTVWNSRGELVFSTISARPPTRVALEEGEYRIEISKPPYSSQAAVRIPSQEATTLKLRALPNYGILSPELLTRVRAFAPIETSSLTLGSLLGVTASALTAIMVTLTVLSALAVLAVHRGLYVSCAENLQILRDLGMSRSRTLETLGPTTFLLSLAVGIISAATSSTIYQALDLDMKLTILGYGLVYPSFESLAYTLGLGLASWAISTIKPILGE